MRFVIAAILMVVYMFIALATAKGINSKSMLISYIIGAALAPAIIAALFCIPKSGRNNKRFFMVLNISLILVIGGRLGDLVEISKAANKPPQTVIGSNNKIEITVPGSWIVKKLPNENVVLNLSNDSGYLNIIVTYERVEEGQIKLEDYANFMGAKFKENAPNFESISSISKCGSTSLKCLLQVAKSANGEKGTTTVLASLKGEDGYYNFAAITNPGLLDRYHDDIFNALGTLKEVRK